MELIKKAAEEYTAKTNPICKETTEAFIAGAEFFMENMTDKMEIFYPWLLSRYTRVINGWYRNYSPHYPEYLKTTKQLWEHWLETYDGK